MKTKILIMGVSSCGKSIVGQRLAKQLGLCFYDGDSFHSKANIKKMRDGIPLNDQDRKSWLHELSVLIKQEPKVILACSALTPKYRDQLKKGNEDLTFVYLKGSFELILSRLKSRENHYFSGEEMLKSQFDTLIEPKSSEAIIIDIDQSIEAVISDITSELTRESV